MLRYYPILTYEEARSAAYGRFGDLTANLPPAEVKRFTSYLQNLKKHYPFNYRGGGLQYGEKEEEKFQSDDILCFLAQHCVSQPGFIDSLKFKTAESKKI